jgi:hypothetical protein
MLAEYMHPQQALVYLPLKWLHKHVQLTDEAALLVL